MMALNRLRLRHLARQGGRAARRAEALLQRTDRLLGVILLGNNLLNAGAMALVSALTLQYFKDSEWALPIATVVVTFFILVFSEITPKVIGATYPERIALPASFVLGPLLRLFTPAVWFVNLFVNAILRILGVHTRDREGQRMTAEELRTAVLEGGNFIPTKHRSILLNLFELEALTVDDLMTPRARIETLDISQPVETVLEQLRTCYHNKLPAHEGDLNRTVGILHVRKLMHALADTDFSTAVVRNALAEPYFIPSGTSLFQQLQLFQDNQQRLGLVVDEYGEVQGLVTLEDIVEEIVGEFTTQAPGASERAVQWDARGQVVVDGTATLRELNRRLALRFPLSGPRTLNGLVLETLQEIPDGACCIRLPGCVIEIVQIHDQAVRSVRLVRHQ